MASSLTPLQTKSLPTNPPAEKDSPAQRKRNPLNQSTSYLPPQDNPGKPARQTSRTGSVTLDNSPISALSPSSSDSSVSPSRKFRVPVRVSRQASFTEDTSPQSRRRSLSLASDEKPDIKPRSQTTNLPQLKENKTPEEENPKPTAADSPAADKTKPLKPSVEEEKTTAVSSQVPISDIKMSSNSSPEAQKTGIMNANPAMGNRGMDFSMQNGNMGGRVGHSLPLPNLSGTPNGPVGNLLKGPVDDNGNLKAAALTVGIKLDLEAEVHLSARVRGDILVGLY